MISPTCSDHGPAITSDGSKGATAAPHTARHSEQLLHGEPHPWNVLRTAEGPLFIDFENCAHGQVEYDLAWAPTEVSDR